MLKAKHTKYILNFKRPAKTSRDTLKEKECWFIKVWDEDDPNVYGTGECSIIRGLSFDDRPEYEEKIAEVCERINEGSTLWEELVQWPSIRFGLEMAIKDLSNGGQRIFFNNDFVQGQAPILINGLIWMGDSAFMSEQIVSKLKSGYKCIKMKIGAIEFDKEMQLISEIRKVFPPNQIQIRVDANGAFEPSTALGKLEIMSQFGIHSIEQPIKAGQYNEMAELCRRSPIPIALDEELIPVQEKDKKLQLLEKIRPQYIILKPSMVGGFSGTTEWILAARELEISWWITSALESNIGLNAIAQYTAQTKNPLPQGLGTGQLFTNNIPSPLVTDMGYLHYQPRLRWGNIQFEE